MSDTDPTEAMVKREIAAARRIIQADKILSHLSKSVPPEDDGITPPKKDKPNDTPPPRTGLWWGEPREPAPGN